MVTWTLPTSVGPNLKSTSNVLATSSGAPCYFLLLVVYNGLQPSSVLECVEEGVSSTFGES